jgi:hypothetical protein
MTKSKKKGLLILLSPWIIMASVFILYSITRFIAAGPSGNIVRVVLSLIGTLNILWIPVGTIIGIVLLAKNETSQPIVKK